MICLLRITSLWLLSSLAVFAAGSNTVQVLIQATGANISGPPVVGPTGTIYWSDTTTGPLRIVADGGSIVTAPGTTQLGNLPVGAPTDAKGSNFVNLGQHYVAGPSGGFAGKVSVNLNGTTLVANRTSTIAGLTNGDTFSMKMGTLDSDTSVVFLADSQPTGGTKVFAVCRSTGGSSQVIVKSGETAVPGVTPEAKFTLLWKPVVNDGVVLFYGEGGGRRGLYQVANNVVSKVMDDQSQLPGFPSVPAFDFQTLQFANEGTDVAVAVAGFGGAVWKRVGGTWSLVAKTGNPIPDGDGNFFDMAHPAIRGGRVAFMGGRNNQFSLPRQGGIYLEDGAGGLLTVLNADDDVGDHTAHILSGAAGGRWWGKDNVMAAQVFSAEDNNWTSIVKVTVVSPTLTANPDDISIRGTGATKLDVLANDIGPFGTTLQVTAVTQGADGKVTLSGGKVSYKPDADFTGADTFTYTLSGGAETATGTVTVTNPFLALRGTFATLVTGTGGAAVGTLNATLTVGGTISGKLVVAGKSYTLKGSVNFDGSFTQSFKRKPTGTPDFVLALNFADTVDSSTIAGSVAGDPTTYTIPAGSVAITTLPAGVKDGPYTLLLPPDGNAANPRGIGWAKATLTKLGKFTITGRLGDDTTFSAGTTLNAADLAVLYVPLYTKPKGELAGALAFDGSGARTLLTGTLAWRKPAQDKQTGLFLPGFTATTAVSGAAYGPPLADARALNYRHGQLQSRRAPRRRRSRECR